MKQNNILKKIIILVLIVILIAGIVVIATKGLNIDLEYSRANEVSLYINKETDVNDIKEITNEVLGTSDVIIQKVEIYADSVQITAREITEEQRNNLVNKINEKYETQIKAEETDITVVANVKGRDLIKPYIIPFLVASLVILMYLIIRYRKLGIIKVIIKTLSIIVIAQAELLSILAITRIPVGRLTIPMVLIIYLFSLIGITTRFEKQLEKYKEENKEKEEEEK